MIWLSVPVSHDSETIIQNACICKNERWAQKHVKSIEHAYKKSPYFDKYADGLFKLLLGEHETISMLNIEICKWVMRQFNITTELRMSSEFEAVGDKFSRPLDILKEVRATSYLSGPSAMPYTPIDAFESSGISLEFKSYDYLPYNQLYGEFEPNLSVIDLLFNCGEHSRAFLKSLTPNLTVC